MVADDVGAVICGILKRGKGAGVVQEEVMAVVIAPSDLFDIRHRKHLRNEANMKNDSGPAFPCDDGQFKQYCGMSLRDWFAGQALCSFAFEWMSEDNYKKAAEACYQMADSMLKARE